MSKKNLFFKFITIVLCFATVFLFSGSGANALKFDFVTVTDVVKKVRSKFSGIDSYSATFSIKTTKLGKQTVQSGTVKSKKPNYLLIQFTSPANQKIVSDGKMMWIYVPSMNVVAEQDLKEDKGTLFSGGSEEGLNRLFAKYHYKFASKEEPVTAPDGKKYWLLTLEQKESRSGYKTIDLWINEDYMITKSIGTTSSGKTVEAEFTNIKTDENLSKGLFKFEVPSNARIIKNPMISEE